MSTDEHRRVRGEEYLAARVVLATQASAICVVEQRRHARALARALWPTGGAPRAHTWTAFGSRAAKRARKAGLPSVAADLDKLGPSPLDTAMREAGAPRAATLDELFATAGRVLFALSKDIQDAESPEDRWRLARMTLRTQCDPLERIVDALMLIEDGLLFDDAIYEVLTHPGALQLMYARPDLPAADAAEIEQLRREGAEGRRRLEGELGSLSSEDEVLVEEPERSPEETLARLERVASELTRLAPRLGPRIDRVLLGGAPPCPTTFVRLIEAIDARIGDESDGFVLDSTELLDRALLALGPPEAGTEMVLRRSAQHLMDLGEKIREASPERAPELARFVDKMLRLVAANTSSIAAGAGEPHMTVRLTRLLGIAVPGLDPS